MRIDIRPDNSRLSRAHALGLTDRIRNAFASIAHRIIRILVRVGEATRSSGGTRECTIEVHLANGEVMHVRERQRKLGALLRRATERAWKAVNTAFAGRDTSRAPAQRART